MEGLSELGHLFVTMFLYHSAAFMVIPAITDVTMAALCPGKDECGVAIYLTGFQQVVTGMGALVLTPLIGNLSDKYGRKTLLMIPLVLAISPLVTLAYSRRREFFCAYIGLRIISGMVSEGTVHCLALAYVADKVPEAHRATAFGLLSGVTSAAFVCGTFSARFLVTPSTFQVAAIIAVLAVVYMMVFLVDSNQSLLSDHKASGDSLAKKAPFFQGIPSLEDIIYLLRSSRTLSLCTIVAFFNSLAESGYQASLLYYLKAQFHFDKNKFADLMLIAGVAGTLSQLIIIPVLVPKMGEAKLLSIGLCASWIHIFLYGIAWSFWVPYAASIFAIMVVFTTPCIRTIISKTVGADEQGKAQGCLLGISSFATIISPLVFTPLTALFLSEQAPFHFPGLSIMCAGLASMVAFIQSMMIRSPPPMLIQKVSGNAYVLA